jgi:FlgD Ig-like domain
LPTPRTPARAPQRRNNDGMHDIMTHVNGRTTKWLLALGAAACTTAAVPAAWAARHPFDALQETRPPDPQANLQRFAAPAGVVEPRVLLAGDSWAQYMWDDGSHNAIFDTYGLGDHRALSLSLSTNPGPGYTGAAYAVSGSEAREWVDTVNFPYLENMVTALEANPTIDVVLLSIGGNDVLAGKPDGGWYKDMDLDVPGSEAAFFARLHDDVLTIVGAALAVRPDIRVILSSYDYPNFNVGPLFCWIAACPIRDALSRDPTNDLITDQEINTMMVMMESMRVDWANADERILYDNGIGLMHYFYGDGVSAPGVLPHPGPEPPLYAPFPGGNPLRPTLRSNFRNLADPIHLNVEAYQQKITNETQALFFPTFRGTPTMTFVSLGGSQDGWSDGSTAGTDGLRVGDTGASPVAGILTFDTSGIPDGATLTGAALFVHRKSLQGTNPFESGALGLAHVDIARGSFGTPDVEPSDLTASADATDAGPAIGSAHANGYVVRFDIDAAGLAAIDDTGLTQFRLVFADGTNPATATYAVFADGDDTSPILATVPTLSQTLGSAAPFLDVTYSIPSSVQPGDGDVAAVRVRPSFPNPFGGSTTLSFRLLRPTSMRLAIYDVAGRRVTTLLDRVLAAGEHQTSWDGRDARGHAAGAGVYWARLEWDGGSHAERLVRVEP